MKACIIALLAVTVALINSDDVFSLSEFSFSEKDLSLIDFSSFNLPDENISINSEVIGGCSVIEFSFSEKDLSLIDFSSFNLPDENISINSEVIDVFSLSEAEVIGGCSVIEADVSRPHEFEDCYNFLYLADKWWHLLLQSLGFSQMPNPPPLSTLDLNRSNNTIDNS